MNITRRDFFKITGTSAAGAAVLGLGLDLKPIKSHAQTLKIRFAKESTSICCYCAVGCGVIAHTGKAGAGKIKIYQEQRNLIQGLIYILLASGRFSIHQKR